MRKRVLPLTDLQVQRAKPKEKDYKLSDGRGLYLLITPKGGKHWRFDYTISGKRKTLAFKSYPEISLAEARQRREDARKLIASDVDPSEIIKAQKQVQETSAMTFEVVAREWFSKNAPVWSDSHIKTIKSRLERDVYPVIGNRPIAEIERAEIKNIILTVGARGVIETADRIKTYCNQIFRYALNCEYIKVNPASDLKDLLPKRVAGNHAAITDPTQVGKLLRAIDGFEGSFIVKKALQLAPKFFVRPGELRKAEWSQINFETGEWRFFITKTKTDHIVPLARQAITILQELHKLTGNDKYVFPCHRSKERPMSENALIAALRRMAYTKDEMTPHGFRATARTILDEVLQVRVDYIELQLAHAVKDANGRAYNRTTHLEERKKMMQLWADYLDGLKIGAKVIPLKRDAA